MLSSSTRRLIFHRFASTAKDSANFDLKKFDLYKLAKGPNSTTTLTKEDGLYYYTQMKTCREMELACAPLFKEKYINMACHLYSGQEACAAGILAGLKYEDKVIGSYRGHAWAHLCGATVRHVLAECTGRASGNVHGKAGSMHMYTDRYFGGNAILCGQVPNGTGMALAMKLRKEKNLMVTVFAEGTFNQGQVFESFNMAKLWDLPVLFVVENNRYLKSTLSETLTPNADYYTRGDYLPGIRCDGIDILTVREAARFAREYMMAGKGPLLLELQTENQGHTEFGNGPTRCPERDPVIELQKKMLDAGLASQQEFHAIDKKIEAIVESASNHAKTDPFLPHDALYTDVFHNTPSHEIRDCVRIVKPKYTETRQMTFDQE
ncbi:unnamed protein product [Caenorhabditis angaria]|uniref:Dehydrogenase E1 component domain-containing protein n=1 Tax=Caenorhabditis angaria TaxID=860376 RepID=A0A9P1I8R3_9PELO|nr:unnamed protein product [Caenorhabditis angaria]